MLVGQIRHFVPGFFSEPSLSRTARKPLPVPGFSLTRLQSWSSTSPLWTINNRPTEFYPYHRSELINIQSLSAKVVIQDNPFPSPWQSVPDATRHCFVRGKTSGYRSFEAWLVIFVLKIAAEALRSRRHVEIIILQMAVIPKRPQRAVGKPLRVVAPISVKGLNWSTGSGSPYLS